MVFSWGPTSGELILKKFLRDLFGVKAASNFYSVPDKYGLYVVTRAYVSACATWCWRVVVSMFRLCSFRGRRCQAATVTCQTLLVKPERAV